MISLLTLSCPRYRHVTIPHRWHALLYMVLCWLTICFVFGCLMLCAGLLQLMQTEDELAAVLAHEVGGWRCVGGAGGGGGAKESAPLTVASMHSCQPPMA